MRCKYGGIAQLARAFGSYPKCHRFESCYRYHRRVFVLKNSAHHGPVVKRSRHRPFTAVTRVRFPVGSPKRFCMFAEPFSFYSLFLFQFALVKEKGYLFRIVKEKPVFYIFWLHKSNGVVTIKHIQSSFWQQKVGEMMIKKPTLQELLMIPNILTYFRFLFIPVFVWQYLGQNYLLAGLALALSALTDLFDGKIARKFNMITEIGILLDPVADKLTEGAVLLCLAIRYPLMWWLIGVYLVKEGFMTVAGAVMLRKKKKLGGAMWFGKVCTTVFYAITLVLTFWPNLPDSTATILMAICGGMMLFTFIRYAILYFHMAQNPRTGSFDTLQSIKDKQTEKTN